MYLESMQKQVQNLLTNPKVMQKQREILVRFEREADKNDGLALATRISQLNKLCKLAQVVRKSFTAMTREDLENFIYNLKIDHDGSMRTPSTATINQYKIVMKKFFKWLHRSEDYPDVVKWIKISNSKKRKLPEDILTPGEVRTIIDAADNLRDKALVSVLYESACRLGEITGLKQRDAVLDQYGAVILLPFLEGNKTGQRRIRLIDSAPDLALWLNNHPRKDPGKPLFCNVLFPDNPLGDKGVQDVVKKLARRAGIKKNVHPHLLRHSRMTCLAKDFTESELKIIAGWSGDSRMPGVYIHLSGADIEKKQLMRAGLLDKEEARREDNVLKPRDCPRCKEVNPATARFCYKCGMALDLETAMKIDKGESGMALELMDLVQREPRLLEMLKNITKPVAVK